MEKAEFINLSSKEQKSFINTVKEVYSLGKAPTIPKLPSGANLNRTIEISTNEIKGTFSGTLGFGGLNVSASANYEHYAMDIMKSTVVQGTLEGPVFSATYGVGCRIFLKIKKTDVDIQISLSQLAAQTELGLVDTRIALKLIGFKSKLPDIPDGVFAFTKFDLNKFTKVNQLINNVVKFLTDTTNANTYDPSLIGVNLKQLYSDDIEDILNYGNYALWRIKNGSSLKDAFNIATKKGLKLNEDIVRRVYALIMQRPKLTLKNSQNLPVGELKPKNEEEAKARDFLTRFRIVTKKDVKNLGQ